MPHLTREIRFGSPLHRRLAAACRARIKAARTKHSEQEKKWDEAEKRTFAFIPEREVDALRRQERERGVPNYTTIMIPYTYAVLLTAHTYWTTVFLARNPIHQFTARHGEPQQSVLAVESLMDYQVQVGGQTPTYFSWLYDAGKWGAGILGIHWEERTERVSNIHEVDDTVFGIPTGRKKKVRVTEDVRGYHGNSTFNVRPQDFFHDPRVPLIRFQDGEFCGTYVSTNWNRLIEGQRTGRYTNLDVLKKMLDSRSADERELENEVLDLPDPADFGTEHVDGKLAAASVTLYELYVELIPEDWGLGRGNAPEKWLFTITADFKVVIGATPMGFYHNKFPFVIQPIDFDAYNIFPRSMPEVNTPIQDTLDWLINSHFYNIRSALNNQLIIDPSRITLKDVLNPLPGKVIRARPQAYGTDLRTAWGQLEMQDVTRTHMNDTAAVMQLGERVHGVNDAIMGLSSQSSRRSATEVRSSNTFGINRLKTVAEYMAATGWGPLAQMQLQNTQQFMDREMQLRIVGDLAITSGTQFLNVTPEAIQGFYDYVPVDGTLPVDRFAQATLWRELLTNIVRIPQIAEQYDIGKIFAWVAQLTGLRNINQFRIQVVPDGQLAQQAQQGNVVQMGESPRGPQNPEQLPQPEQARDMGQVL